MGGVEVAIVTFVNINHLCKLGKKVFDTAGGQNKSNVSK